MAMKKKLICISWEEDNWVCIVYFAEILETVSLSFIRTNKKFTIHLWYSLKYSIWPLYNMCNYVHNVQVLARSLVGWNSLGAESWHGSLVLIEWIIRPELLILCFSETLVQSHDIDVVNNQFIPDWSTSINQWKKKPGNSFHFSLLLKKTNNWFHLALFFSW